MKKVFDNASNYENSLYRKDSHKNNVSNYENSLYTRDSQKNMLKVLRLQL